MKTLLNILVLLSLFPVLVYSQSGSINNTLSSGGTFTIKDGSNTFFSLSQSNGFLTLNRNLLLPTTGADSTVGVMYKGGVRFIHDYHGSGTLGYNTFVGLNAGNFTMSGTVATQASYSTAVGYSSLESLTTGTNNSAFGFEALSLNTSGDHNSALGAYALNYNQTGSYNSAFGYCALTDNQLGWFNSAFGDLALNKNKGDYNSAFGYMSLSNSTECEYNSAFGSDALGYNETGGYNSAFGSLALYNNHAGNYNSAFGFSALVNSTGSRNTALGDSAGLNITTGSNNTCIGSNAYASGDTVTCEITLGDNTIRTLRCNVNTITALSDARDKRNIKDLPLGLEFLMNVKPRQFNWDRRDWYKDGKPNGSKMQATPTAGFIAQELDEVQKKEQAEWLNLVLKSNPNRLEATPGNLLPIMVKAIQELKAENDALKSEIVVLRSSIPEQIKKEVQAALLKTNGEDKTAKVTLNEQKKGE